MPSTRGRISSYVFTMVQVMVKVPAGLQAAEAVGMKTSSVMQAHQLGETGKPMSERCFRSSVNAMGWDMNMCV